jgi:hypothetical protein
VERGGVTLMLGGGEKKEKGWVSPVTMEVVADAGRLGVMVAGAEEGISGSSGSAQSSGMRMLVGVERWRR